MMINNINCLADTTDDQPEITITQNDQCILQNDVRNKINF